MKKIILYTIITILILFFLVIGYFLYVLFGNTVINLNNITDIEKQNIINLMNLDDLDCEISLEKMEIPNTYKDIYYKIYFELSEDKNMDNIKSDSDIYTNFVKLDNDKYSCTISNMGKNIELLEEIRKTYEK